MRRPWPGEIVFYRMWAIGLLAVPVLLLFVDWFPAIFLSGCLMGAYGALIPVVYDGKWSRDEEGDNVWLPKEPRSSEPPEPPLHVVERGGTREHSGTLRYIGHALFGLIVVALLFYMAIDTFLVRK
jgi:hypothetical protein